MALLNSKATYLPRLIRAKDAPWYLGMDRNKFNREVRPHLTEIPLGSQAIAFDRFELEDYMDDYIERNGRRPKVHLLEDDKCQTATECQAFAKKAGSGTSKSVPSTAKTDGSGKAQERLVELQQKKS